MSGMPEGGNWTITDHGYGKRKPYKKPRVSEEGGGWTADIQFARVSVENLGPVSGDVSLKPLTVLFGPPQSGVAYMASLLHAVVEHGRTADLYDNRIGHYHYYKEGDPLYEQFNSVVPIDKETERVLEKWRQSRRRSMDSDLLKKHNMLHTRLFVEGMAQGLLGRDSPLHGRAGLTIAAHANHTRCKLSYSDNGLTAVPDEPNLHINFVGHSTARKYTDRTDRYTSGPYIIHDPYPDVGPRPYEVGDAIHIDVHDRPGEHTMYNALYAAFFYYTRRISQPWHSILVSSGSLIEYTAIDIEPLLFSRYDKERLHPATLPDDTPDRRLLHALDCAKDGDMIVVENPEEYTVDADLFAEMLYQRADAGLYLLVVTGDRTLAERIHNWRPEPEGLDSQYVSVYEFKPRGKGYSIVEW